MQQPGSCSTDVSMITPEVFSAPIVLVACGNGLPDRISTSAVATTYCVTVG